MSTGHLPQPPPKPEHRSLIGQLAQHVARNGPQAEEALRRNHFNDPRYAFLFDGREYNDFYKWCLVQELNAIGMNTTMKPPPHHAGPPMPQPPLAMSPQQQQQQPPVPLMGFFAPIPPSVTTHSGRFHGGPPRSGPGGMMGHPLPQPGLIQPPRLLSMPPTPTMEPPPPPRALMGAGGEPPRPLMSGFTAPPPPPQQPQAAILPAVPPPGLDPAIQEQIAKLKKQITDSEANLKAHQEQLQAQKAQRMDDEWRVREERRLNELFTSAQLQLAVFEPHLERLAQSGSKDTISSAKKWVFDNCQTDQQREMCLTYLLHKVRCKDASESLKLHVLYLINEWAHHCHRKKLDSIRQMLSRYVPKLYAYASTAISSPASSGHGDSSHLLEKLDKLVGVWEASKYFDDSCYKQMRNPASVLAADQVIIQADQQRIGMELQLEIEATMRSFEKQHSDYEKHMQTKIAGLEAQQLQRERDDAAARQAATLSQQPGMSYLLQHAGYPTMINSSSDEKSLIPKCPYYELPAGMMVPLVGIEECTYKPIPLAGLRIPPPVVPNEHLLRQLDRFYQFQATPDNPRDADGWEAKGLLDYYVKKAEHREMLEQELKKEGKTFEDAITNRYVPPYSLPHGGHRGGKVSSGGSSNSSSTSSSSSSSSSSEGSDDESSSRRRRRSRREKERSRSASPQERPSFSGGAGFLAPTVPAPLDRETNKGAQLMAKMGWEGKGLGAKEQGIEEPIHGGHIRGHDDKYVGVGVSPINALLQVPQDDPYAEYRRQMSLRKLATFKK